MVQNGPKCTKNVLKTVQNSPKLSRKGHTLPKMVQIGIVWSNMVYYSLLRVEHKI